MSVKFSDVLQSFAIPCLRNHARPCVRSASAPGQLFVRDNITVIGIPLVIPLLLCSGFILEDPDANLSQETNVCSLHRIFQRRSLEFLNLSLHAREIAAKDSVQLCVTEWKVLSTWL